MFRFIQGVVFTVLAFSMLANAGFYFGKIKSPYGWTVAASDDPVMDAIVAANEGYSGKKGVR